ncbi:hypothetical protein ACP70R_019498 [Stipagrostis hirtigluma subsp. patula]
MASAGGSSSLPAELLEDVSSRLSTDADRLHIRKVCAQWRAYTSPLSACRPWIIAGREPWQPIGPIGEYSFWLPRGGREICPAVPAGLPYCCGSPCGWLALADSARSPRRLILWEPISKAEILLPCLPAVAQVFLSGDPLAAPGWTAVACQKAAGSDMAQRLLFWRPGDAAWSPMLEGPICMIDSAAFHQGRAYFIGSAWQLHIFDLEASPPRLIRKTYLHPSAEKAVRSPGRKRLLFIRSLYVVPCDGECLLVVTFGGRKPAPAEVYRADWVANPVVEVRERVRDLGEYSLFVGRRDTFALSAKEFPAIRRNCVYYVEHDRYQHEWWATIFDLGTKGWEPIPYPAKHMEEESSYWQAYSWFCPRNPLIKKQ